MKFLLNSQHKNHFLLLAIILLTGALLRFYDYFNLPYFWDELSALSRLKYDSFYALIELGVKPDGHPAGVQVFLYYWTAIFGEAEWIVKLPFNLMGLASIYITYRIWEVWFHRNAGLLAATFVASLQFFVLYSPIARPYGSGLFLTLLTVLFWSLYFFKGFNRKHLIYFILFATLSAYNHHFSLLFVAIVGLSGALFITKEKLLEYLLAGLAIFILYLPHLSIFLHQFGVGGIGGEGNWLGKPDANFVWDFLYWSVHYSVIVIVVVGVIFVFNFLNPLKGSHFITNSKKRALLFLWFVLPIIIGYYYSIYVNPVIQYSMLIFSFPYLIILIFSGLKELKPILMWILVIAVLIVNSSTLILKREHYQIVFRQMFNQPLVKLKETGINPNEVYFIHHAYPVYQDFYLKKFELEDMETYSVISQANAPVKIDSILQNTDKKYILASGLNDMDFLKISQSFPNLIFRSNGYTHESYLFGKEADTENKFNELKNSTSFQEGGDFFKFDQSRVFLDSILGTGFNYNSNQEWGIEYNRKLGELLDGYKGIIDIEVDFISNDSAFNPLGVIEILNIEGDPIWLGYDYANYTLNEGNSYKGFLSLDCIILQQRELNSETSFRFLIWNNKQNDFLIKNIKISTRKSNPIKYGLFYPLYK